MPQAVDLFLPLSPCNLEGRFVKMFSDAWFSKLQHGWTQPCKNNSQPYESFFLSAIPSKTRFFHLLNIRNNYLILRIKKTTFYESLFMLTHECTPRKKKSEDHDFSCWCITVNILNGDLQSHYYSYFYSRRSGVRWFIRRIPHVALCSRSACRAVGGQA